MTISKDLFLAILSMDAYNRGFNAGIDLPDAQGTQIGAARINRTSEQIAELGDPNAASFYAVAYDISGSGIAELDGTTVISYRGTDEPASELLFTDFPISFGGVWQQSQQA
jgi:hypothetical protein